MIMWNHTEGEKLNTSMFNCEVYIVSTKMSPTIFETFHAANTQQITAVCKR